MVDVVVYVNSAHEDLRYVREAARSAASFRRFLPDAEFVLFTDAVGFTDRAFDRVEPAVFEVPENLRDTIHKNGQMVAKLRALPNVEGDRVLYLGSDTYALREETATLFALLDRFDIAAAHAPYRLGGVETGPLAELPPSFPELNCDLVLWRRSAAVVEFLGHWRDTYLRNDLGHPHDQGAFRSLLYRSDLRVATLPPEFNHRGPERREDTVILQNRDLLPAYLAPAPGGHWRRRGRRAVRRLRRWRS